MRIINPAVTATLVIATSALPAWSVTLGQIDTFEDGTTQGWVAGAPSPAPPANLPTGGPAGADDNFLRLASMGGVGAGSRLSAFNLAQWAGDYTAAGVTSITMDVNNLGAEDVAIRLLLADPVAGPPTNVATTDARAVSTGSGWRAVAFSLEPDDLTALQGSAGAALSQATELRIFHSPAISFPGPAVVSQIGLDNIRAGGETAVPEPASLSALCAGLGAALLRRRGLRPA